MTAMQLDFFADLMRVVSLPVVGPVQVASAARPVPIRPARRQRGQVAYLSGVAAENGVADHYARAGFPVVAQRWRGKSGEVDLILRDGSGLVFVEIKKSSSFDRAAHRVSRRQMDRICGAACEFLAGQPRGQMTDMRFDVALVDGTGQICVIQNAFGEA